MGTIKKRIKRIAKLIRKHGPEKVAAAAGIHKIPIAHAIFKHYNDKYKKKLGEDFIVEELLPKASKPVDVFLGRMNPPHIGHQKIIASMKNPVVVLVKGAKSSQEKDRNPLPVEYQETLLKKIFPDINIIIAKSGFLPAIFGNLRRDGMEPKTVFSGADRIAGYRTQIDKANEKLPSDDLKFDVEFKETERITSATTVRNALKSGDLETFKKSMPRELWGEFDKMREYLTETSIMGFKQYLEDVTAAEQISDKPRNLFDEDECDPDFDLSDEEYALLDDACLKNAEK